MHGGEISVQSAGVNQGTEFQVRLPIVMLGTIEDVTSAPRPPSIYFTASSRRKVLVVDDNLDAARTLALMVKMFDNEVRIAHDGEEAMLIAAAFLPEVILMDIGMPKVNGYDAARSMRQQKWGQNITLVALTGWGQEEDKKRAMEAGFDHHLVKPADPAELRRLLMLD